MTSRRDEVTITTYRDGPLIVRGPVRIQDQEGREIAIERETVALCRCGKSRSRPLCDGTHKLSGFRAPSGLEDASRAGAGNGSRPAAGNGSRPAAGNAAANGNGSASRAGAGLTGTAGNGAGSPTGAGSAGSERRSGKQ